MSQYLRQHSTRATPQSEPIDAGQEKNSAGGFGWPVDEWTRARRFLILGAEGGTYYVGERQLVADNAATVSRCLEADPIRMIDMICDISDGGLAKSNDPALFALAMAVGSTDLDTRREAWRRLPQVARIGTHLFHFIAFMEQFRGWGPMARRGVGAWYSGKEAEKLAYQLVKYRQRDGWSHRDVLRKAHPEAPGYAHKMLYDFACGRAVEGTNLAVVEGFLKAQEAKSPAESAALISEYGLPREAVLTDHLKAPEVWDALLPNMPITALIRNLANLTRVGIIKPMSEGEGLVAERLSDEERLRKGRVHPLAVLSALTIYERGHSALGRGEGWEPSQRVVDALDSAFYTAFGAVEPANKRTLLAVDVSGSMGWGNIGGVPGLTPRVGAAAMSLVTAATEPQHAIRAFSNTMVPVSVSPKQRLDDVLRTFDSIPMGGTDCSLPMTYALETGLDIDTFVVYTDSETWAGNIHPAQALRVYREKTGINARLIVVGMEASEFSIADPNDAGMLDVVGFDSSAPAMMSAFSRGEV